VILAHTLGPGGPDLELLILAAGLLALGIAFFFQRTVKPVVSVGLVGGAIAAGAGAFSLAGPSAGTAPNRDAQVAPDVRVSIESPSDGDSVPAGEPIQLRINLEGGTLGAAPEEGDTAAGHLHIFVDGELKQMVSTDTARVELEAGPHTILAEFTAVDHSSYAPPIVDEVEVTAE
jgi:hypothetical protein